MIDRLLSACGWLAALADGQYRNRSSTSRLGRLLGRIARGSWMSALLVGVIGVATMGLGVESFQNPTPRVVSPAEVEAQGRPYVSIAGYLDSTYVETFDDVDEDGQQDEEETGSEWFYFMRGLESPRGLVVRSERPPVGMFARTVRGLLVEEPARIREDIELIGGLPGGLEINRQLYIDETGTATGEPTVLSDPLAAPAPGTHVSFSGAWQGGLVPNCPEDTDRSGICEVDEAGDFDYLFHDPLAMKGIIVRTTHRPELFPATLEGMLRDQPAVVRDALDTPDLEVSDIVVNPSNQFVLHEGERPASAPLALGGGVALLFLAAALMVGAAIGHVVFRQSPPLPSLGSGERLAIGAAIPLHVTGRLRMANGLGQVRERAAVLTRVPSTPETGANASILAVTTPDGQAGVGVGRGELRSASLGTARLVRSDRPAIRAESSTGELVLSFDSKEARDRAYAELRAESVLVAGPDGVARASPAA